MQLQENSRPAEVSICEQTHAAETSLVYGSVNPHGTMLGEYNTRMVRNAGSPYGMMLKCTHVGWQDSWDPEKKQWDPMRPYKLAAQRANMNTQDPT